MVKIYKNQKLTDFQRDSQSKSTKRVYLNDIKKFEKYCDRNKHGMHPLDVDDDGESAYFLVSEYLYWLNEDHDAILFKGVSEKDNSKDINAEQNPYSNIKYKSSTIERILASLTWYYRNNRLSKKSNRPGANIIFNRKNTEISSTLKTIKNKSKEEGVTEAKALVKEDIIKIIDKIKIDLSNIDLADIRDKALILVGFYSFCRRSEILNLHHKDLTINDENIILKIPYSKTDQTGKGRQVILPRKNDNYCPVDALNKWLEIAQISSGPLFYKIYKSNTKDDFKRIDKYTLNKRNKKVSLSDTSFNLILKKRAFNAGYNKENISGHSLRRGAITEARRKGISIDSIKTASGHKSNAMISKYTEEEDIKIESAANKI